MKVRQYIIVAVAGVVIFFLGGTLMGFFSSMKTPEKKKKPRAAVTTVPVQAIQYSEQSTELEYFGRVSSYRSVAMIAEVQGEILAGSVPLKDGQRVRKGQLLFQIDNKESRLTLQSTKSQFMKSIADILADLKVDYPESFPVWQSYFEKLDVTEPLPELPEVKDLKEKTFLSTRGIFSSYYNILASEERLTKYRMYAPFSGNLQNVQLEAGAIASPGSRIATLVRTDQLELVIPVRDEDLQWLTEGTKVIVRSEGDDLEWTGQIARIGELVDAATQSVNVYVRVNGTKEQPILEGQYLNASLPGKVVRQAMEVPRSALFDGHYVYTIQDSAMARASVTVHKENPQTAIISGLPAGTTMVTEIPLNAKEGLPVKTIAAQ